MERAGWLRSDYLTEDEIARERAHSLGVPFVVLTHGSIEPDALVMIPEPLSRAHSAVAYALGDGVLEVALLRMSDLEHIVALHPHIKIQPRLTTQASIKQALVMYQKHLKERFGSALQAGHSDALIRHALLNQASDIHLDVQPMGTRVRYRIGGVLHDAMHLSSEAGAMLVRGIKEVAKLFPIAVAQEGKFKIVKDDEAVRVSVANVPAVGGEKLTLRLSPEYAGHYDTGEGFTLSMLGLHGKALEDVQAMIHARSGLVLVAGKSESGKTTMLYTLLDHVRGAHLALASIEESIEHQMPTVSQTRTRPELGLGMLEGLRAVLRTDPDVLMIGNIESAEVAAVALEAAARGVLVFGAIDSRSAAGAVEKLLAWEISPSLLASTLRGSIATKLVDALDTTIKLEGAKLTREESSLLEEYTSFSRVLATLKEEERVDAHTAWKDMLFYHSNKRSTLTGIQEVLPCTLAIKEMIVQNAGAQELQAQAREEGMLTLAEDALFKAAAGVLSLETALEVASE